MATLSITTMILTAGVVVLVMRGNVRRADNAAIRAAVSQAVLTHRPTLIRMDFSAVSDIDTEAAAQLIETTRETAGTGTAVTITNTSPHVRRQIAISGGEHLLG